MFVMRQLSSLAATRSTASRCSWLIGLMQLPRSDTQAHFELQRRASCTQPQRENKQPAEHVHRLPGGGFLLSVWRERYGFKYEEDSAI